MGFDRHRVMEVFVKPVTGRGRVGSGYRVTETAVLTAGHVVTGLPVRSPAQVTAGDESAGRCELRVLGEGAWMSGSVLWRDESADVALIGLAGDVPPLLPGSPAPRWGRVDGMEPVAVSAVGFPWVQERPDRGRDSEQLFGFIAPATTVKAGLCAVTVQTAAPAGRAGGSPWAGMSGAALFAGPFLVAVVVVDPARFEADRVVAAPIAPLVDDAELAGLLDLSADGVAGVGPRLRLAVTAETSLALAPPYRPAPPWLGREPTRLLLPEYGIVPFAGRDGDLDTLQAWCLNGTAPPLRLITGAGGSGKTRLAAEACVRMAGQGWQAGFADPKAPGGRAQLEFDRPTLLVVDDADLNVPLLADLVRTVSYWPPGTPAVRLLLLARHTTSWWDTLNRNTDRAACALADSALELRDGELTPAGRADQHARALTAFAAHLPDPVTPAGPVRLADRAFANPLLVHMHALLTVCGAQVPATGDAIREWILDAVLDRERDRWAGTFPAGVPTGGARTRQQAVAVATLLALPTEIAAGHAMAVIDEFAPGAAAGARAAVATWLRGLYPGSDPPWVAPLRPDLLAEQLLATCAQLTEVVLAGYASITMPEQAEQILTELTRAGTRPPVRGALDRLLNDHLPDLLTAAVDAPAGLLPDLLDHALQLAPQPGPAAALAGQMPEHSVPLAALAATLASQQVTQYRADVINGESDTAGRLARSLSNLANRLAGLGRREDALAAGEEAAGIYRELAAARPEAFRPDLAMSLSNLASRLAGVGRREDALAAGEEAAGIYRELVAARPDTSRPDLAGSLHNLANRLADLGRREDALAARRGSRWHLPGAGRGPLGYVPPRPGHVAERPGEPAGWPGPVGGRAGRDRGSRHHPTGAGRGPPGRLPARPGRVAEQPVERAGQPGPAGGRAGRGRGSRWHLPGAGRGPPGGVPPRPGRVAEQPVAPAGWPGQAGGRAGRDQRSRWHLPGAGRGPPGGVPPRPGHVAEQPGEPASRPGPAGGRAGRERGSRHHPTAAGHGPPGRVPAGPGHVAEQPVAPAGWRGPA